MDITNTVLNDISARFYSLFNFLTDPFWGWLFIGLVIIAAVIAVTYFFGGAFTWLRPIGGVILMLVTFGLYAFRKGERSQQGRDEKHPPPLSKPPISPAPSGLPSWWPFQ